MRAKEDWTEIWVETVNEFNEQHAEILGSETANKIFKDILGEFIEKVQRDGQLAGRIQGIEEALNQLEAGVSAAAMLLRGTASRLEELNRS
jgi:hypothetical protein